ncbi:MAG: hypothetical protein J3Q66DRAFT_358253 [Benniella sp.]|nr:MAG: hypothetical protein J3Q66DRAFT_358253 [Benniella sp.]
MLCNGQSELYILFTLIFSSFPPCIASGHGVGGGPTRQESLDIQDSWLKRAMQTTRLHVFLFRTQRCGDGIAGKYLSSHEYLQQPSSMLNER